MNADRPRLTRRLTPRRLVPAERDAVTGRLAGNVRQRKHNGSSQVAGLRALLATRRGAVLVGGAAVVVVAASAIAIAATTGGGHPATAAIGAPGPGVSAPPSAPPSAPVGGGLPMVGTWRIAMTVVSVSGGGQPGGVTTGGSLIPHVGDVLRDTVSCTPVRCVVLHLSDFSYTPAWVGIDYTPQAFTRQPDTPTTAECLNGFPTVGDGRRSTLKQVDTNRFTGTLTTIGTTATYSCNGSTVTGSDVTIDFTRTITRDTGPVTTPAPQFSAGIGTT
jgi:hypothetical protein